VPIGWSIACDVELQSHIFITSVRMGRSLMRSLLVSQQASCTGYATINATVLLAHGVGFLRSI
jgi:hypothetical protein